MSVNASMPPSAVSTEARSVLATFHDAVDAVALVLATNADWGESGRRDGQYAVDLAADRACLEVLSDAGFGVLSEESGLTTSAAGADTDAVVVVDPLDGSTNAARGVPWYATALCLVADDAPQVAMVANHATGDVFTAVRGSGAWRDGGPCRPTGAVELADAVIGVSGWPTHHYGWAQFRAMGASAPDICNVACGVTDGWCDMNDGHGVWDYLASVLIAEEAGCAVGEVFGRDLCVLDHAARRGPAVAATPELLRALLGERTRSSADASRLGAIDG